LPGGRQEWGESVVETLLREVREETGLAVRVVALIDVVDLIDRQGTTRRVERHYTLIDYLAEPLGGTARAGSDASEIGWFPLGRLPPLWSETVRVINLGNQLRMDGKPS
jgi:8-oxo-dGTP diphosphatase